MNDEMPQSPQYGVPEDGEKRSRLDGLREFSQRDQRTFKQMMSDQPKMNVWEKFACCCGCIFIIPVMLVPLGLLFA